MNDVATPCPFCEISAERRDPGVLVLRDGAVAAFPAKHQRPSNVGHILVVPVAHHENLYDLPDTLLEPLMVAVRRVALAVEAAFGASGTSVRLNNGHPGQDVFHAHFHVIPRHADDGELEVGAVEVPLERRLELAAHIRSLLV